jgi:protein-S-isoprenylcysteine O-methyltransferase Ste14
MQEKYCIEKYGEIYIDYMKKTPRILFIKGKNE